MMNLYPVVSIIRQVTMQDVNHVSLICFLLLIDRRTDKVSNLNVTLM